MTRSASTSTNSADVRVVEAATIIVSVIQLYLDIKQAQRVEAVFPVADNSVVE